MDVSCRAALAPREETQAKSAIFGAVSVLKRTRVPHWYRGLNDDQSFTSESKRLIYNKVNGAGIESISVGVVVGRRRDYNKIRAGMGGLLIKHGSQAQLSLFKESLDVNIRNRRLSAVNLIDAIRIYIEH